jgi:DNA repair exonuclease SbcCD ATPase subunit
MPEVSVGDERVRLNFWQQLDPPFLVNKTPYQLFDFIAKSKEQERINTLQEETAINFKKATDDAKLALHDIDSHSLLITAKEDEVAKLQKVNDIDVDLLEGLLELQDELVSNFDMYKDSESHIIHSRMLLASLSDDYNKLNTIADELAGLFAEYKLLYNAKTAYETASSKQSSTNDRLSNINESIDIYVTKLAQLDEIMSQLTSIEAAATTINNLIDAVNIAKSKINASETYINNIGEQWKQLETELSQFDVCPLCGNSLVGGHSHG